MHRSIWQNELARFADSEQLKFKLYSQKGGKMQNNHRGTAVLLCGGTGSRMGAEVPKQFLVVDHKPVIIHTIERIEAAACIKQYVVVVHADWKDHLMDLMNRYGVRKCIGVTAGGATGLESMIKGIEYLKPMLDGNELVTFVDGVRPLVSAAILEDSLRVAGEYGAAVAMDRCYDTMLGSEDGLRATENLNRDRIFKAQRPESTTLELALDVLWRAQHEGFQDAAMSNSMLRYGKPVGMSKGSPKNIKITTPDDLDMFKALLNLEKDH